MMNLYNNIDKEINHRRYLLSIKYGDENKIESEITALIKAKKSDFSDLIEYVIPLLSNSILIDRNIKSELVTMLPDLSESELKNMIESCLSHANNQFSEEKCSVSREEMKELEKKLEYSMAKYRLSIKELTSNSS